MQKNSFLLVLIALFIIAMSACKKEYKEPVYTPEKNKWIINTDTFGPSNFIYYDTANVLYGAVNGKCAVYIRFWAKPVYEGDYLFRNIANEPYEISITIIDSIRNYTYYSAETDSIALKDQQYAKVSVKNGKVSVSFNDKWLQRLNHVDQAKVSMNIE